MVAPEDLIRTHDVVTGEELIEILGVGGDEEIDDLGTHPGVIQVCDGAWVREIDHQNWRFWVHPDADPENV